jgi:hypothetical protein
MTQGGEHLRQALGLVNRKRARVRVEKAFQIGSQHGEVGWTFEIEVGPFREGVARKCALAALPRTHKKNGGKRSEEGVKTIGTQSIDIFHALQFSIKGSKLQGMVSTTESREACFSFHPHKQKTTALAVEECAIV